MKYELTDKEVAFIKKAMIHSANIYKTFHEYGSKEYPLKETSELITEVNRIIDEVLIVPTIASYSMITESDRKYLEKRLAWTYVESEDLYYIDLSRIKNGLLRKYDNISTSTLQCIENPSPTPKKLHLLGTDFTYHCKPEDIVITKIPFWCHIEEDPSYTFGKRRILIMDK